MVGDEGFQVTAEKLAGLHSKVRAQNRVILRDTKLGLDIWGSRLGWGGHPTKSSTGSASSLGLELVKLSNSICNRACSLQTSAYIQTW